MSQEISTIKTQIIDEFNQFADWTERYKYLIAIGKDIPNMPEGSKTDDNIVKGCQSRVWLHAELEEGKINFTADSDAAIVRGLIALLVRFYSGQDPETIFSTPPDFITEIGMDQHLSMTRSNGLASMVKQMKIYAMAYKAKMNRA
jgi:cysteine desulfuration protein SufE